MATIRHQVGVSASLGETRRAIDTLEGVSGWWTKTTGDYVVGGTIEFDFVIMKMPMRVVSLDETHIEWEVLDGDEQWRGTHIIFDLEQRDGQVMINFRHDGWQDTTDLFDHCSTKWAVFMLSLKDLIETGTGRPVPDDIEINHY